jgi:hypothetical protein
MKHEARRRALSVVAIALRVAGQEARPKLTECRSVKATGAKRSPRRGPARARSDKDPYRTAPAARRGTGGRSEEGPAGTAPCGRGLPVPGARPASEGRPALAAAWAGRRVGNRACSSSSPPPGRSTHGFASRAKAAGRAESHHDHHRHTSREHERRRTKPVRPAPRYPPTPRKGKRQLRPCSRPNSGALSPSCARLPKAHFAYMRVSVYLGVGAIDHRCGRGSPPSRRERQRQVRPRSQKKATLTWQRTVDSSRLLTAG